MQILEHEGYSIKTTQSGSLCRIEDPTGGRVPGRLEGFWTKPSVARTAIDGHLRLVAQEKAAKKVLPKIQKAAPKGRK